MSDFFIWWTSQGDAERVMMINRTEWPWYLRHEFTSRYGRPGRGRLWVSSEITGEAPYEAYPWDHDDPICQWAEDAGGIVIKEEDYQHVAGLPGFVTTFDMSLLRPSAVQ